MKKDLQTFLDAAAEIATQLTTAFEDDTTPGQAAAEFASPQNALRDFDKWLQADENGVFTVDTDKLTALHGGTWTQSPNKTRGIWNQ